MMEIPFVLIFFTSSFFSGMPGLFTTSSALRIFSSLCLPSSKSIPACCNSLRYISFKEPPSERKTSYPFCFASKAAPTPLSPPPSITIFLFIFLLHFLTFILPTKSGEDGGLVFKFPNVVRGLVFHKYWIRIQLHHNYVLKQGQYLGFSVMPLPRSLSLRGRPG